MKQFLSFLSIVSVLAAFSCSQGGGSTKGTVSNRKSHQADTGYTGIEVYKKGGIKAKEVEYKNGIKDGMTKTYYPGLILEQEIPYVNGKKNGIAKWYYTDGYVFRTTPYENDTINGEQLQYYKSKKVKARIKYINGLRFPKVDEYNMDGTKITNYPKLVYRINDNYKDKGSIKIFVEMSDNSEEVKFYRGDFVKGLLDLNACIPLMQTSTTGYVDLKKTIGASLDSVHVIGSYLTPFGNRYYSRLSIPLPYKDLK
jgi:hypothetical protein